MPRVDIRVIDHRDHDLQPEGRIVRVHPLGANAESIFADYHALLDVYHNPPEDEPHIGFFGYRKYLWLPGYMFMPDSAHAPNWWSLDKATFDQYRAQLARDDGANIAALLGQVDMAVAAPYPLKRDIWDDFKYSRSIPDGETCERITQDIFPETHLTRIYPYLFVARWNVFQRMMEEIEPIREKIEPLLSPTKSTNEAYNKRPMAYVMERVFSLWLENSLLEYKELPLLHSWETK